MKQLIFILSVYIIAILSSCSGSSGNGENNSENISITEYNDSLKITHGNDETRELRDGLEYGFVNNLTNHQDGIEGEMLRQFNEYSLGMQNGNISTFKKFLNSDVFHYFQNMARNDGEDIDETQFCEITSSNILQMKTGLEKSKYRAEFTVCALDRKIIDGDNIFIVFSNATNITSPEGISAHFVPIENTVAISEDNGQNWTFVTLNDSFPNIFDKKYSEAVINAIMGY